jgi:hypothetical protein
LADGKGEIRRTTWKIKTFYGENLENLADMAYL